MTDGAFTMDSEVAQAFSDLRDHIDDMIRELPCSDHIDRLAKVEQQVANNREQKKANLDWFKVFMTLALVGLAALTYFR